MEKLDKFKQFVKENPVLLKYIKNNEMTWQKFYEMYDMYGDDKTVWNDYISIENKQERTSIKEQASLGEVFNFFKGVNLDSVQEGIESIQRVVGMLGDLTNKNPTSPTPEYKPRPLYKHFDD